MKKILLTLTVFFVVLTLSGCDLFNPGTVEQISEEYCRENPDSEICQGDSVGDLLNDDVINVFNTILTEYDDTTNDTFCEDYFSVTNVTLLDECRASRSGLFPEDITQFTIDSVTKKTSLSTADVYTIQVSSPDGLNVYVFEVSLTKVEGVMYINGWEFTTKDINPTQVDVPFDIAKAYFEQFISDYTSSTVSSDTVCQTYFAGDDDPTMCAQERDDSLNMNLSALITSFVTSDTGYTATLSMTDNDGTYTQELELQFEYSDTGQIIMTIADDNSEPDMQAVYRDALDTYITALQNENLPIDDFCNTYEISDNFDDCKQLREQVVASNAILYVLNLWQDENGDWITKIQFGGLGEPLEMEYKVQFVTTTDDKILIHIENLVIENNQLKNFILDMIKDFQDNSIDTNTVCTTYFTQDDVQGCSDERDNNYAYSFAITLDLFEVMEDGRYHIILNYSDGTTSYQKEFKATFIIETTGIIHVSFDSEDDYFPQQRAFVESYIADFTNPQQTTNSVCTTYFSGDFIDECAQFRDNEYSSDYNVSLAEFYTYDGVMFTLIFEFNNGTDSFKKELYVDFEYDGDTITHMVAVDPSSAVTYEDAKLYIEHFISAFNDTTIGDQDFVDTYVSTSSAQIILQFRNERLALNDTISDYMLNNINGVYEVEFIFTSLDQVVYNIYFTSDVAEYADFFYNDGTTVTWDNVWSLVNDLTFDINGTMTNSDICSAYFSYPSTSRCETELDYIDVNNIIPSLSNVYQMNDYWQVEITYIYPDNHTESVKWELYVFMDTNGDLRLEFTDTVAIPESDKMNHINNFMTEFNDGSYDASTLCNMFVGADSVQECSDLYAEIMNQTNYSINWYLYDFYNHPNYVEFAVYDDTNDTLEYYIRYTVKFFYNENNELRMDLSDRADYTKLDDATAQQHINTIFADLNNISISDDVFNNTWGYLFNDVYSLRSFIQGGESIVVENIMSETDTAYEVTAKRYDNNTELETYIFHIEVYQDLTGNIIITGWQESNNNYVNFDLQTVSAQFHDFIAAYFDPTITDEELQLKFNNGAYIYGIEYRADVLQQGYVVSVQNVTEETDEWGGTYYQATLDVTFNNVTDTLLLNFNVYPLVDGSVGIDFVFDWTMPDQTTLQDFATNFVQDILDTNITDDEFCLTYFSPFEFQLCTGIREQLQTNNYTVQFNTLNYNSDFTSLSVDILDDTNNLVSTIEFGIFINYDVLGNMYINLMLQGDDAAYQAAMDFMTNLADDLRNDNTTISDFCAAQDCNGIWSDNALQISDAQHTYVDFDFRNFLDIGLRSELYIEYSDGSYEYVKFAMTYTLQNDNTYAFSLRVVGREVPVPDDATLLDQTNTKAVLDQFIIDIKDATISAQDFCDMYFGGVMREEGCLEGRPDIISMDPTVSISEFTLTQDEDGNDIYYVVFQIDNGENVEDLQTGVRVYQLPSTSYIIEFIDFFYLDPVQ